MQIIQTGSRQSLIDIAVQHTGDAQAVVDLSVQYDISITEELEAGTAFEKPEEIYTNIVNLLFVEDARPVSREMINMNPEESGIDFWAIENDFEVQ